MIQLSAAPELQPQLSTGLGGHLPLLLRTVTPARPLQPWLPLVESDPTTDLVLDPVGVAEGAGPNLPAGGPYAPPWRPGDGPGWGSGRPGRGRFNPPRPTEHARRLFGPRLPSPCTTPWPGSSRTSSTVWRAWGCSSLEEWTPVSSPAWCASFSFRGGLPGDVRAITWGIEGCRDVAYAAQGRGPPGIGTSITFPSTPASFVGTST